jgi:hypothetical protein
MTTGGSEEEEEGLSGGGTTAVSTGAPSKRFGMGKGMRTMRSRSWRAAGSSMASRCSFGMKSRMGFWVAVGGAAAAAAAVADARGGAEARALSVGVARRVDGGRLVAMLLDAADGALLWIIGSLVSSVAPFDRCALGAEAK